MFSRIAGAGVVLAAVAFACGAASAQSGITAAQEDELYCVYEQIGKSDQYYEIGENYLITGTLDLDSEIGEALVALTKTCATRYAWDDGRSDHAMIIGVIGTAADVLSEYSFSDLSDPAYDAMLDAVEDLTDADIDSLITGDWMGDEAVQARAKRALGNHGFAPKDETLIEDAIVLLELHVSGVVATQAWIEEYLR